MLHKMKRYNGVFAARSAAGMVFCLCLLLLLGGCMNSENPDLLDAPLAEQSIRVRLLNLAGDHDTRALQLENTLRTEQTAFGALSGVIAAPADSALASIVNKSTVIDYTTPAKLRFSRNSIFTILALPAAGNSVAVDTLLTIVATDTVEPRQNNVSYVRFINAFPSAETQPLPQYSLRLGCPNGTVISSAIPYLGSSGNFSLEPGTHTISLVKSIGVQETVIGYYSMTIGANNNYSIILHQDPNQQEALLLLHDRSTTADALQTLVNVPSSQAEVRVLNLSTKSLNVSKTIAGFPDETIASGVPPLSIGAYAPVSACTSANEDTLRVEGGITHVLPLSLEVLKRYTIITTNYGNVDAANYSVALEPVSGGAPADSVTIRAVNLAWDTPSLEISFGARTTAAGQFVTGRVISANLAFGEVSTPSRFAPGPAPLVIFSNPPKQLQLATYVNEIRAGGSYLLVIQRDGDRLRATLIDEKDDGSHSIEFLNEGVFTQIVNAIPDAEKMSFSFDNVIRDHALFYGSAAATVLPIGDRSFSAGSASKTVTLEQGKRTLILISGSAQSPTITVYTTDPMGATRLDTRRRVINASPVISQLEVLLNRDNPVQLAGKLPYLEMSATNTATLERKVTVIFRDQSVESELLQLDNIPFNLGQNTTLLFAGNGPSTYRAIILQEF